MATREHTTRRRRGLLAVGLVALATSACTALDDTLALVPFFSFMRESAALDPYEMTRPAPENSVPFASPLGAAPLPHVPATVQPENFAFWASQQNTAAMSEEILAAGEVLYMRHCTVCHAANGTGNGPATGPNRFPFAPTLVSPTVQNYPDGYIYGVIREGRGLMPAYGGRVSHNERWYIVNYVRLLQQQAQSGATQPAATGAGTTSGED